MVPIFLADSLATQGFCHDLSQPNISDTVACHDRVMRMSDEEVGSILQFRSKLHINTQRPVNYSELFRLLKGIS